VKPLLLVLSVVRNTEMRSSITKILEAAGHRVVQSNGCAQAHLLLTNGLGPDLVFVESPHSESSDLKEYKAFLHSARSATICLISRNDGQSQTREANEFGIRHLLKWPPCRNDLEAILDRVKGFREAQSLNESENTSSDAPDSSSGIQDSATALPLIEELGDGRYFLAAAPAMLKIYRQVQLLADVDAPVLILGESGTGKEVIAHLIHKHSRRSQHRFLNVNCAALPADLLESELFGYQQGAFTGAIKDKPGKFEQANRGTLLLDEIGEMSAQMQAKLLHVLQDGQFTRLGARESSKVDVRVLAATNAPIENALLERTFREDLYYRLNVFTINVPPLRERREEIPYLIEEIVRRSPAELRKSSESSFSSRLMDAALLYDWRGNARELRNFVTRTMTMRDPDMAIRELETKVDSVSDTAQEASGFSLQNQPTGMRSIMRDVRDRAEAQLIQNALEVSGWNRRHAAKYLNISYRGLLYKIQQHRLTPKVLGGMAEPGRSNYSVRETA
jgi:two-component system, NtrC family, response regulator AtoC